MAAKGDRQQKKKSEGPKPKELGCSHYWRKCAFISPCCNKQYTCRVCHNENEDGHELERTKVVRIVCLVCSTQQSVSRACCDCGVEFAKYFCEICRMYDSQDKKQFHCEQCGICRIGGRENFFHCAKCNMCISIDLKNNHKCVEDLSRDACPVCIENLHTSRLALHFTKCGHLMHRKCFEEMLEKGLFACPKCNQSTLDLEDQWKHMDEEIARTPMPEEYQNKQIVIHCRDCQADSTVYWHVIGMKCSSCGSYNTCQ